MRYRPLYNDKYFRQYGIGTRKSRLEFDYPASYTPTRLNSETKRPLRYPVCNLRSSYLRDVTPNSKIQTYIDFPP